METNYYVIKCTLIFKTLIDKIAGYGKDTRECFRCSITDMEFKNKDDLKTITSYYDIDDRFTPSWVKDYVKSTGKTKPEYLNFKSNYPLTIKERRDDEEIEIDRENVISGAKGYMLIAVKHDGNSCSIYPSQFLITENGKTRNVFDDCNF